MSVEPATSIQGRREAWSRRWAQIEQAVIYTLQSRALRTEGADWTVELGPGTDITIHLHATARTLASDGSAPNVEVR